MACGPQSRAGAAKKRRSTGEERKVCTTGGGEKRLWLSSWQRKPKTHDCPGCGLKKRGELALGRHVYACTVLGNVAAGVADSTTGSFCCCLSGVGSAASSSAMPLSAAPRKASSSVLATGRALFFATCCGEAVAGALHSEVELVSLAMPPEGSCASSGLCGPMRPAPPDRRRWML